MYRRSQRWMQIINNRFLSLYDYNFLHVIEKIRIKNSKICGAWAHSLSSLPCPSLSHSHSIPNPSPCHSQTLSHQILFHQPYPHHLNSAFITRLLLLSIILDASMNSYNPRQRCRAQAQLRFHKDNLRHHPRFSFIILVNKRFSL